MESTKACLPVDGNDPGGAEEMTGRGQCETEMNDGFEPLRGVGAGAPWRQPRVVKRAGGGQGEESTDMLSEQLQFAQ